MMIKRVPCSSEIEVAGVLASFVSHGLEKGQVLIQTSPGNIHTLMRKLVALGLPFQNLGNGRGMVLEKAIKWRLTSGSADEECNEISYGGTLGATTAKRIAQIQRARLRETRLAALAL